MLAVFLRGFLIVSGVSWNVANIAERDYQWAFCSGLLVSLVWWFNTRTANRLESWWGGPVYAVGAGCGTLFGMWLGTVV